MEFKMNYFIVFRIYRLDPNGISPKIFEPLVIQLYNYFIKNRFDKKICEILKSSKTEFGRNRHIG